MLKLKKQNTTVSVIEIYLIILNKIKMWFFYLQSSWQKQNSWVHNFGHGGDWNFKHMIFYVPAVGKYFVEMSKYESNT